MVGGANGFLALGLITMNADEMSTQVVLATERAATGTVRADMGFQPVGVVRGHVCFEIVRTSERCRKLDSKQAPVFLAHIAAFVIILVRDMRHLACGDGRELGGDMGRRDSGASVVEVQLTIQVNWDRGASGGGSVV